MNQTAPKRTGHGRRRLWASVVGMAVATAILELGVFLLTISAGASYRHAVLAALATATVWIALAAGPSSAGPDKAIDGLLIGGVTADATVPVLLGLWLWTPWVTLAGVVKIYCILASMAMAAVTVTRLGRTRRGRTALGGLTAILLTLAISTPVWANGLMVAFAGGARTDVAAWCVRVNPFYAIADATVSSLGLVWHESPRMYALTALGDRVAVAGVPWYAGVTVMLTVAGIALAGRLLRRPGASPVAPEDPPAGP